jgi:DMSO reductase anchor subunit
MFLPDSPNPALTVPATRFCSDNPALSTLRAADRFALKLEPAHWPLIMMLLLTQAASGLTLTACFGASSGRGSLSILVIAGILLAAGLLAASLHLGQPLKAWRAFLGWRTSWLSRELIALHIFAVAIALALCCPKTAGARQLFIAAAAVCGLTAVFTSAMVYIDTGRAAWAPRITLINFFGTTVVLGAGGAAIQRGIAAPMVFLACALAARAFLFVWRDFSELRALNSFQDPLHRRALITQDFLRRNKQLEAASFLAQAFSCLVAFGAEEHSRGLLLGIGALAAFGGELACRYEFFVASAGKRMPGGVVT